MKQYRKLYLIIGIIISVPLFQLLFAGVVLLNIPQCIITFVVLTTWWCAYTLLVKGKKNSLIVSLITPTLFWGLFIWEICDRLLFMRRFGMEGPNGEGSPLAFLVGLVFEVGLFLLLTLVVVWGLAVLFRERKKMIQSGDEKPNQASG